MTSSLDFNKLKELYTAAGQGQVFRFEEKLNEEEKIAFYEQLQTIDVEGLAKKYAAATNPCTYSIIPATRIAFSSCMRNRVAPNADSRATFPLKAEWVRTQRGLSPCKRL